MLRVLLVLMVAANVAFFAWTRGWLGPSHLGDREPDRVNFSYQPEAVRITPLTASSPAPGASACLESGPYSSAELASAEVSLASLAPVGTWVTQRQERRGLWVVYLGPLPDVDALARKEAELKRIKMSYEAIRERGELDIGIVLGRFSKLEEAESALAKLNDQAVVRNANVVNLVQPSGFHVVRVQAPSPALAQRLTAIQGGALKAFGPCPRA